MNFNSLIFFIIFILVIYNVDSRRRVKKTVQDKELTSENKDSHDEHLKSNDDNSKIVTNTKRNSNKEHLKHAQLSQEKIIEHIKENGAKLKGIKKREHILDNTSHHNNNHNGKEFKQHPHLKINVRENMKKSFKPDPNIYGNSQSQLHKGISKMRNFNNQDEFISFSPLYTSQFEHIQPYKWIQRRSPSQNAAFEIANILMSVGLDELDSDDSIEMLPSFLNDDALNNEMIRKLEMTDNNNGNYCPIHTVRETIMGDSNTGNEQKVVEVCTCHLMKEKGPKEISDLKPAKVSSDLAQTDKVGDTVLEESHADKIKLKKESNTEEEEHKSTNDKE